MIWWAAVGLTTGCLMRWRLRSANLGALILMLEIAFLGLVVAANLFDPVVLANCAVFWVAVQAAWFAAVVIAELRKEMPATGVLQPNRSVVH